MKQQHDSAEDLPRATRIARRGIDPLTPADDHISLDYDMRLLRRKRLVSDGGLAFLLDLPELVSLDHDDAFMLADGRQIAVIAADEPLIAVRGDLPRLAWHIGNRHTPCQIDTDHLVIRHDHVLADMLRKLGADLHDYSGPFRPEGGAYGHGRTFGHDHGPAAHEH